MNLSTFLDTYKAAIAQRVVDSYPPQYHPAADDRPLPPLLRSPLGAQETAVRGTAHSLASQRGTTVVGEMGTGKTFIATAAAHLAGFQRILVLVPPHLTKKWKREIEATIPDARAAIVTSITALERLRHASGDGPLFAILSRERAKLSYRWQPAVVSRWATGDGQLLRDEATGEPFRVNTLDRGLRRKLDKTVREARQAAEAGAGKILEQLAIGRHEPHTGMDEEARQLRNRLRAHARQLGDKRDPKRGTQAIDRLVRECAYEHWHRMLFARFLAESDLLIEPESGVPISLEECRELAREEGVDWLELASGYAERMLPQIFRGDSPVLALSLPPETRSSLEDLFKDLPREVFTAEDSLGWVYQFWQADRKDAVNRSEKKIGADELPAVTQLFTEDYMVLFLLHNTLGAWWAGKVLAGKPGLAASAGTEDELRAACAVGGVEWTYLRFVREEAEDGSEGPWRPAAGAFEGWPKAAKDITVLDPCMGSGHFLVFALPILVALRMSEGALTREAAVEAVLHDNLFGLEIDLRCTEIAAFNLAFAAWKMAGHRPLPPLNLACSGLAIGVGKAEWIRLAENAAAAADPGPKRDPFGAEDTMLTAGVEERVKNGLATLHDLFARAPWLGSLIDPRRVGGDIFREGFDRLEPLLGVILAAADTDETREMAVAAQGMAAAANLLGRRFTLVATNVPFLGRGKQHETIRDHLEAYFKDARSDLATAMLRRLVGYAERNGTVAAVTPQSWLFLKSYAKLRQRLLRENAMSVVAALGPRAFETISGEVVNTALVAVTASPAPEDERFAGLDANDGADATAKAQALCHAAISLPTQSAQRGNPDQRITLEEESGHDLLSVTAHGVHGLGSKDTPCFFRQFWEISHSSEDWEFLQTTVRSTRNFGGMEQIVWWCQGDGLLHERGRRGEAVLAGGMAWGEKGVIVSQMKQLPVSLYGGDIFDKNTAVILPRNTDDLPAIWAFCSSPKYFEAVRNIDRKLNVTNATLVKVPFNLTYWKEIAAERYPDGLPKPHSDDPTQWLFGGNPAGSDAPLQIAVARLLGYRWPRQTGSSFMDCPAIGPDGLEDHADEDGIVCLAALKGEAPASEGLAALLTDSFGPAWSAARLAALLASVDFADKSLDDWLRDGFFRQHCALFHQRPFVWHVWDGLRDGFHALVNYHRLAAPDGEGRRTLEKLIYSYLGDWIDRQRADQAAGVEGADARFAHAQHLRGILMDILEGEPPYDIFVRWKPLHEQAIGWEPDINDGVRMNIRPFMTARPFGAKAKNACILRTTPKIKWQKDRGTEPKRNKDDYPWFWGWDETSQDFAGGSEFDGKRWNDLHYNRAFKQAARDRRQT